MAKKLRLIGLLLTVIIGIASIIGSKGGGGGGGPIRPYVRIDNPSFVGHAINDIAETIVDGSPLMVAVGYLGSWTSSDGLTWNFHGGQTLKQVIKRGNEFFAVTDSKSVVRSSNGQNWNTIFGGGGQLVNHISIINAGGLLAVGKSMNPTNQYWWPAVWTSADGVTWERHFLEMTASTTEAYAGAHHDTLLVVGGSYSALTSSTHQPRFWYSEDNGANWASGTGPFTTVNGKVQHIVSSYNDVFYASSSTGSFASSSATDKLWKSNDGKTWAVVEDPEVANPDERFSFHDDAISQSNVLVVVGSRAGGPATWGYTKSNNTWKSSDASKIFGSEPPTTFTGIGVSANIAPGYVYTGYYTVGGTTTGAIWLRQPN